ncbi:hypothetical protein [Clostridium omnivorum]|uniref:Uncharacterized protein n=1 Tax=Clostridium omnivorum TaxID=1604902 RepID=A0ABQ5NCG6_9CLOT|nr:hypothetical protein [Clostridium sp. E14]GLC32911.1 hypothetical protein bsdE14_43210 [Clostridium sp. E14]
MNDKSRYNEIAKQQEIKKEITKLNRLFKDMDSKIKKSVTSLIENAAFMAVTLRELQDYLNKNGLTCEYQNGENQFGVKKSPEVEIYNTMIKNFVSTMKSLTDLLPKEIAAKIKDDGFDQFVGGRDD